MKKRKRKLTRQGHRAGAGDQRDQPWRRLREALRDHLCRRHGRARDPPSHTRSLSGTSRAAFFFFEFSNSQTLLSSAILLTPSVSPLLRSSFFFRRRRLCSFLRVPPWKREKQRRRERESFCFFLFGNYLG